MRHQVHGKKLNRSSGHRKALYRNMVQSLVEHERITTTLAKAKAVRPVAEKLITRAKGQDLASRRALISFLPTKTAVEKLYSDIAPRFSERPGGYTRIIKTGRRAGDGVEMAILELVDLGSTTAKKPEKTTKAKSSTSAKKSSATKKPAESKKAEVEEVASEAKANEAKQDGKKAE